MNLIKFFVKSIIFEQVDWLWTHKKKIVVEHLEATLELNAEQYFTKYYKLTSFTTE